MSWLNFYNFYICWGSFFHLFVLISHFTAEKKIVSSKLQTVFKKLHKQIKQEVIALRGLYQREGWWHYNNLPKMYKPPLKKQTNKKPKNLEN